MSRAGKKLIEGATEALAIAKGEQPAARIHVNGHAYVPEAVYAAERKRADDAEAERDAAIARHHKTGHAAVKKFRRLGLARYDADTRAEAAEARATALQEQVDALTKALAVLGHAATSCIKENDQPNRVIFKDGFIIEGRAADEWLKLMRLIASVAASELLNQGETDR